MHEKVQNQETYPFHIPSIRGTEKIVFQQPVTFFVGENGAGKSTLLEAIADQCEFNTAGGGKNHVFSVDEAESDLGDYIRLSWLPKVNGGFFLRAESFYQFATYLDGLAEAHPNAYDGYGGKSLHHQSHGESFLSLFTNRFTGRGIYLLDEPEAALSPSRQLAFLRVIHDQVKQENVQFIIATHSPILLGFPQAQILTFDDGPIREISYEETENYRLTLNFLKNRERFFHELFQEEEDE
jgi:predicted ATPase